MALAGGVAVRMGASAHIWEVGSIGLSDECEAGREAGVKCNNHEVSHLDN